MKQPPFKGGIDSGNLSPALVARLLPDLGEGVAANTALQERLATRPGVKAQAVLYTPANLVNGDTITVGADTFEVDIINTDSGVNTANSAAGALGATGTHALVTLGAAPATAISAGDVIRIESEMLLVLRKLTTTTYVCARAYAGTAIASHVQNLDVFVSDSVPTGGHISVPLVTTLTPAVFGPTMVAVFNWTPPAGEDAPTRTSTENENFTAMPTVGLGAGQQILFVANEAGVNTTAVSEDFSASTDNVWGAATFTGGAEPAVAGVEISSRVPTAAEELVGEMHFAFPFTVREVVVQMVITSSGQIAVFTGQVQIGYQESTDADLPATIVTLRNVGAASTAYITGFAATNTVRVLAFE